MRVECTHAAMVEVRRAGVRKVREGINKQLKKAGVGVELRDAVCLMWALDIEGRMMQWEGMGMGDDPKWEKWHQQVEWVLGQCVGGAGRESDRSRDGAVKQWMQQLAMQQPAEMRQQGFILNRWTEILRDEGIMRGGAESMAREMIERCDEMWERLWTCRVQILHEDPESVKIVREEIRSRINGVIDSLTGKDKTTLREHTRDTECTKKLRKILRDVIRKQKKEEKDKLNRHTLPRCWNLKDVRPDKVRVRTSSVERARQVIESRVTDWIVMVNPEQLHAAERLPNAVGVHRRNRSSGNRIAVGPEAAARIRKQRTTTQKIDTVFARVASIGNTLSSDSLDSRAADGLSDRDEVMFRQEGAGND
jgi:hypothetical protein